MPQSDIFRTEEVEETPPTPLPDLRAELKEIEDALAGLGGTMMRGTPRQRNRQTCGHPRSQPNSASSHAVTLLP
jgi:hypothetical protein